MTAATSHPPSKASSQGPRNPARPAAQAPAAAAMTTRNRAVAPNRESTRPAGRSGEGNVTTAVYPAAVAGSAQRARWVRKTQPSTTTATSTVGAVTYSPSSSADHPRVNTGCSDCTCPILATPPRASPADPVAVTGNDTTSAQQIVRGPPSSRESAPPSA